MMSFAIAQTSNNEVIPSDTLYNRVKQAFDMCMKTQYVEAIRVTDQLLEYEAKHKDDSLKAHIYNVVGIAYSELGEVKQGKEYFEKSRHLFDSLKVNNMIIKLNNNLGVSYRKLDDLKTSNQYFKNALFAAEQNKDTMSVVLPLYNLATNNINKSNFNEALDYTNKAEVYFNTMSNKGDLSRSYLEILILKAQILDSLKNYTEVKTYLNSSLDYAIEHDYIDVIKELYEYKISNHINLGETKKGALLFNTYRQIKDSINKIEQYRIKQEIDVKYNLKTKEEQLRFAEKKQQIQKANVKKARFYNVLFMTFIGLLLFAGFWVIKKNEALKEAKEKAESVSRIKSDFYSEISHELRTPLYAVTQLSSILLNENENPQHRGYLESLNFSGNHLLSLINNVLELNKMESGTALKLQVQEFDLKILLINIVDSLEYALRDTNNKIHLSYDDTISKQVSGDALKISQVLINLISNAIKFTSNGNIHVTVKKVSHVDNIATVNFKISDDGVGISKENQKRIFENFYQEDLKNDNSYKGTGLGLSIVKRLLSAMDSNINIDSKVGKGTSFYFDLNLVEGGVISETESMNASSNTDVLLDKNILVVDDNKINLMVTKKVLLQLGVKVTTVDNGYDATKLVQQENFDCILMDLHMPELDGYQTTEHIRAFNNSIPIIALTAASNEEVESKIYNYQMQGYLLKPFAVSNFVSVLAKTIQNQHNSIS